MHSDVGVALARKAEDISIWEIVEALDGVEKFGSACILKMRHCDHEKPSPLHYTWLNEKSRIEQIVKSENR